MITNKYHRMILGKAVGPKYGKIVRLNDISDDDYDVIREKLEASNFLANFDVTEIDGVPIDEKIFNMAVLDLELYFDVIMSR